MLIDTPADSSATHARRRHAKPVSSIRGGASIWIVLWVALGTALSACAEDPDSLKISISTPDADQAIGVGESVEFEAKVKGGESPVSVVWDFDSTGVGGADPETSSEKSPGTVTFSEVGEYVITLEGEDDALQTDDASITVTASYKTFVTGFTATSGNEQVTLSWTDPTHPDYDNFLIRRDTGDYPEETTDGDPIEPEIPLSSPVVDEDVVNDTEYFYTIFAYDDDGEFGTAVNAKTTPADTTAPGSPAPLNAVANGQTQIDLDWVIPTGGVDDDDLAGVVVQRSTSGYPFTSADGTTACTILVGATPNDSCSATGLTAGTKYFFSAFAFDDATDINYSARATDTATTDPIP
jgi:hypothetical protein